MDLLTGVAFRTVEVRFENEICFLRINRPEAENRISSLLVEECTRVVEFCELHAKVLVLEGLPDFFCTGADFQEISSAPQGEGYQRSHAEALYDLWLSIARGSFVSVAHVRGRVNAGGVGFVAACDVVLCEEKTVFSLSELLFGLMPACVMPFLIRRTGFSRANYLTLMTQPVTARQALDWQLVDACEENSANLLRRHLLRLRYLPKTGVARYKKYLGELDDTLVASREKAIEGNREVFSDQENLAKIARYVRTGQFPWEED
ncbi:enoyl-CoA hydratase/isomerase [Streptomyces sp. NPDC000594]|uniref:enoyl-CoA hydratase/isomerase n=1 Tax=Streptomyces sp. NPDC000594 TaxID=3154261 RepID=UPI0033224A39